MSRSRSSLAVVVAFLFGPGLCGCAGGGAVSSGSAFAGDDASAPVGAGSGSSAGPTGGGGLSGGASADASVAGSDAGAGDAGASTVSDAGAAGEEGGAAEVAGPSAALFAAHPYYTCVTNRYIATAANGGSDSADGTAPTVGGGHGPWLTFEHANASLPNPAPGYCVNVGDGTYTVASSISLDHGGREASMTGFTVWRSSTLLGAKLVATSSASDILQATVPYLIFDGLDLNGGHYAQSTHGINTCFNGESYNGIHHVFVLDSYVHDMGGNGVANCWAEYFWLIHNRLDGNAYNSWNSGASTYEPVVIPGYGATPYDDRWTPYHNVYVYNRASANFTSPAGSPHTDGNGIEYDDTQHTQNPPSVVYAPRALFMGNISWSNGGFGLHIGPNSSNADVVNNTTYDNGLDTLNDGTWRGEISSAMGSGNVYKNNIAYAVVGAGILANNTPYLGGNPISGTNSWANNIAFGGAPNMTAPDAFTTPLNKVNVDPSFVDLSAANYALQSGSPAIGAGVVVPYWPQQTAGAVDIGACPHGVNACP